MITIKSKMPSASMEEIKSIADGIEKIGASSRERINLLLEVGCLVDSNKQNVVTVAADGDIADKSQGSIRKEKTVVWLRNTSGASIDFFQIMHISILFAFESYRYVHGCTSFLSRV